MMNPEAEEDAIRYVLGEMSPEEELAFEQRLNSDPELAAYVAELREAFGAMAGSVPQVEPPAGMRDRIMNRVSAQAVVKAGRGSRLLLAAMTGALVLMLALFFTQRQDWKTTNADLQQELATTVEEKDTLAQRVKSQDRDIDQLETDKARLGTQVTTLQTENTKLSQANAQLTSDLQKARNEADMARFKLASLSSSVDETYGASLAWNPMKQSGMVEVAHLPANEPGKQYQVWIIDEGNPTPISGGVFEVAENSPMKASFTATQPVTNAVAFAISVEETGGVPAPQGPIVLQYGL